MTLAITAFGQILLSMKVVLSVVYAKCSIYAIMSIVIRLNAVMMVVIRQRVLAPAIRDELVISASIVSG